MAGTVEKRQARARFALLAEVLAIAGPLALGCAGHSVSKHSSGGAEDAGEGVGASGTGAGGGNVGGTGGSSSTPAACRRFAARYLAAGLETECSFDRPSLALTCTTNGADVTTVTAWTTIADAVAENQPIGRTTAASFTELTDAAIFVSTFFYDDARRLTSSQATVTETPNQDAHFGTDSLRYLAWDAAGRPTRAIVTITWSDPPPTECGEQQVVTVYDDANRTITETRTGGDLPYCPTTGANTSTFDENGILLAVTWSDGAATNYDTLELGTICLDE
jgi:hypothetical protein